MIFGIKPFEIHDGDGIRTTVFLKGCPLRCKWCHNPESFTFEKELLFTAHKCVNCGACTAVCEANYMQNGKHIFDREKCIKCGKCIEVCPAEAFKVYGEEKSVDEIVAEVERDEIFLKECGGGVTVSGGEPLAQPELCIALLKAFKEKGYNTALDTSCFANTDTLVAVSPYVDTFLIDIKAIDPALHKELTGVDNSIILENIKMLDAMGKRIEIRYPFIPTMNDGEVEAIGNFVKSLNNVVKMKLLPYHNFAQSKYDGLGKSYVTKDIPLPTKEEIDTAVETLKATGINIYRD